jgi:hypothetical protein
VRQSTRIGMEALAADRASLAKLADAELAAIAERRARLALLNPAAVREKTSRDRHIAATLRRALGLEESA